MMEDSHLEMDYEDRFVSDMDYSDVDDLAATPDPDSSNCDECGGGLAHFPECSIFRREI